MMNMHSYDMYQYYIPDYRFPFSPYQGLLQNQSQPYPFGGSLTNQAMPFNMLPNLNNMIPSQMPSFYQNPYPNQLQNVMPYQNPYPFYNQNPAGFQSILSQFKSQDGKFDFNKIVNTTGQMVGAVNQISSLVKGISQTFKGII